MTVLVFGKTGQVATELQRHSTVMAVGRDRADLTDPASCSALILSERPRAVINAAAYTAVDKAEAEEDIARLVNADAPAAMARACLTLGIPLVHISTDYVFDGGGSVPWQPTDPTGPLGAYGRTKLAGELAIREVGCVHAILRTSWVFSAHGSNFVKTMLRLGQTRTELGIVEDQVGGPTPAADVAAVCLSIASALVTEPGKRGTYHFSGAPDVSWCAFAQSIFVMAGLPVTVTGIPARDYPTPAQRPANSRMDCQTLLAQFGIARPDWRGGLAKVLAEISAPTP